MRKVQFFALFWTLVLAIPFTVLALVGVAYMTENLEEIAQVFVNSSRTISVSGRGLMLEIAERWPEIAGMVIGQLVILTIFLFARRANKAENIE
jgi:hypothetical protein